MAKNVKYEIIVENDVAVPTHFFKLIIFEDERGVKDTEAYIIPNEEIHTKMPLNNFKTTVEKFKRASGIIFFQKNS